MVDGWTCVVCGATRDIADPFPWRCPNSTRSDRHHLLRLTAPPRSREQTASEGAQFVHANGEGGGGGGGGIANPFIAYDDRLAWAAYADHHGLGPDQRRQIVEALDHAIAEVDGVGFHRTGFARSAALSDELGFHADGGVWVKDETGQVAGSQKARHLASILLHLLAAETLGHLGERPPLAIASCGNAALAAATLAAAASWPIHVYVPTWMTDGFGHQLDRLGATVHRCERRDSDPPGDPAMLRFRDAVADGAIPFTVQGPENALCLDGGRTIGWEIADQLGAGTVDRVFVQVGGGAFATCLSDGLAEAGRSVPLYPVQAQGCAPLVAAWNRAEGFTDLQSVAARWSDVMTVWDDPHSAADGILDDETYDWLGVFAAMQRDGGRPIVAAEADIVRARELATAAGYRVSATGSAGLAGLLAVRREVADRERVIVVMSGVAR